MQEGDATRGQSVNEAEGTVTLMAIHLRVCELCASDSSTKKNRVPADISQAP